jgi:hypothetical protein
VTFLTRPSFGGSAKSDFAGDYADQAERDYKAFAKAIREGRVKTIVES